MAPLADEKGAALDSEGLVVDRDGTYLVTSETEPSIRRYDRTGARILDRLPVPARLRDRATANASFEGLTLLPGGRTLLASMESPLTGDEVNRLQTWRRTPTGSFAPAAQYGYRADPNLGISEVTAAPDGRLLVLERGFTSGVGNTIRLYAAEPAAPPTSLAATPSPAPNPASASPTRRSSPTWRTARRSAPPPTSPSPTRCSTTSRR